MTDTGQVPGEGQPENAGMVEQPGMPVPDAYTFLDPSGATADDDDLLLMPGTQGAWTEPQPGVAPAPPVTVPMPQTASVEHGAYDPLAPQEGTAPVYEPAPHEPGVHEAGGQGLGTDGHGAVYAPQHAQAPAQVPQQAPRRPLHMGPPMPDTGGVVRSLADRGPAPVPSAPAPAVQGPPTLGTEYLDVPGSAAQGAQPWAQQPAAAEAAAAETAAAEAAGGFVPAEGTAPAAPHPAPTQPSVPSPRHGAPQQPHVPAQATPAHGVPVAQPAPAPAQVPAEQATAAPEPVPAQAPEAPAPSPEQVPAHGVPAQEAAAPAQDAAPAQPADASAPEAAPAAAQPAPAEPVAAPAPTAEAPAEPAEPAVPAEPAEPAVPAVPAEPATPAEPAVPAEPATPAEPAVPAEPATPAEPAEPAEPAVPAEPQAAEAAPTAVAPEPVAADPSVIPETAPTAAAPAEPAAQLPVEQVAAAPSAPEPAAAPVAEAAPAAPVTPDVTAPQPPAEPAPAGPVADAAPVQAPAEAVPVAAAPSAQAPATDAPAQAPAADGTPAEPAAAAAPSDTEAPAGPAADAASPAPAPAEAPAEQTPTEQVPTAAGAPEAAPAEPVVPAGAEPAGEAPAGPVAEDGTPAGTPPTEAAPAEPVPADTAPAQAPADAAPAADTAAPAPGTDGAQEAPAADAEVQAAETPAAPAGPPAPGYADDEREAILRVMRERRDIRHGFRSDPVPHEVLLRVLEAAHTAPSVGHSQPWDFVVIRSAETRRTMHELAQRQREAYARSLPKGRAKQFKELKIEAILDTPVNIVVTADPTRGGRHTLGRHTQPQMAPYSSALAVENLWLAARAEGLGVGWVSFFDEREMVRALGLPEHLEVVAYLCVGYVDEFPEEPELMQAGWSKRRPLSWVVHEETYGRRALPGEEPHDLLQETVANIRPLDAKALGEAWERQKRMTKPAGALGMLEIISAQLCGLSRACPPPIPEPAAVAIFAGDHGVHAQGVTAWPQEVTAQMVANFLGGGAVCNAFANQVGAEVCVVDVGVAADLPATPGLLPRKVRAGTADFTTGPALTRDEVLAAIEVGIETARDLVAAGNKAILTGEMGIANTTASAALISVYTGVDPAEVTGRGTGINDEMHARKVDVVRRALDLHQPDPADPIGVLGAVGGLEHAAMVGFILGGASLRTPVVLDGVSAGAAALVARAIAPESLAACIAGHRSAEPGHMAALGKLGLRPLVDLDLRLGEGTGALLALPLVQSAARAMHEVATFDSAGVTEK
ncbi:nicotinate-nucleotide--dimethylbenzimidazole phosphoribosyltransferase [Streptomyces roseolilacinus]|uniref:nicotinate-nucleotide--dimethylbenzimidazole phosphoribosyltransferase n=1 Tax=Streptomyces roseolilacinus TaxID=66904 RepID=UPI0038093C47